MQISLSQVKFSRYGVFKFPNLHMQVDQKHLSHSSKEFQIEYLFHLGFLSNTLPPLFQKLLFANMVLLKWNVHLIAQPWSGPHRLLLIHQFQKNPYKTGFSFIFLSCQSSTMPFSQKNMKITLKLELQNGQIRNTKDTN